MIPPEIAILLLAIGVDHLIGEPPAVIHPVVWMGKAICLLEKLGPKRPPAQIAYGAIILIAVVGVFGAVTFFALSFLKAWNGIAYVVVSAFVLKTTFAVRELRQAAMRVFDALIKGQVESARGYLRHLVSRDTTTLNEPLIVAATVESVAENATDSFVAPILFFVLFGVPGAVVYRVVNTADAMIGYHGRYEYLGKVPARMDDLLNIIPARLAGLLTVLAGVFVKADTSRAWQIMMRDHALTESPNAGWAMSAMSGALGVQLEKLGHYRLGDPIHELSPLMIMSAVKIMYLVVVLTLIISLFVEVLLYAGFA